jgi:hypothetical protein
MQQGFVSLYDPAAASLPDEQGYQNAFDWGGLIICHNACNLRRRDDHARPELGAFTQLHMAVLDGSCQNSI